MTKVVPLPARFFEEADSLLKGPLDFGDTSAADVYAALAASGNEQRELAAKARQARDTSVGATLQVRASLEFSNYCRQACSFCGMSHRNRQLERYRMSADQMVRAVEGVHDAGIPMLHLASGEDWAFTAKELSKVLRVAHDRGLEIVLVLGERRVDDYKMFRDAGADRYILKIETSDPELFDKSRSGSGVGNRIAHLLQLRDLGFKIGSGVICGLPGQTLDHLIRDLALLRRLKPDMASVSRFLPNADSDFCDVPGGPVQTTLNFIALMRLLLQSPAPNIPGGTSLGDSLVSAFEFGANVVSVHVTPDEYAPLYSSYRASARIQTRIDEVRRLAAMLEMPCTLQPPLSTTAKRLTVL